jgi:hypothetical protein
MKEISVGSWATDYAFGDVRAADALEIVEHMDLDVLYLPKLFHSHTYDRGYYQMATKKMDKLGYATSDVSGYTPEVMGIWSRIPTVVIERKKYGRSTAFKMHVPDMNLDLRFIYSRGVSEDERVIENLEMLAEHDHDQQVALAKGEEKPQAVFVGDFESLYRNDPRGGFLRWFNRRLGHLDFSDVNHATNKIRQSAHRTIELTEKAEGRGMQTFIDRNCYDADLMHYGPTYFEKIGRTVLGLQFDHIIGTPGVDLRFKAFPRRAPTSGDVVSSHLPVSARVSRWIAR